MLQVPHRVLLLAGTLLVFGVVAVMVLAWRSPDLDLRCDESKRIELEDSGRDYSCVLQIPEHNRRGH
jgi:hypothetical protein